MTWNAVNRATTQGMEKTTLAQRCTKGRRIGGHDCVSRRIDLRVSALRWRGGAVAAGGLAQALGRHRTLPACPGLSRGANCVSLLCCAGWRVEQGRGGGGDGEGPGGGARAEEGRVG